MQPPGLGPADGTEPGACRKAAPGFCFQVTDLLRQRLGQWTCWWPPGSWPPKSGRGPVWVWEVRLREGGARNLSSFRVGFIERPSRHFTSAHLPHPTCPLAFHGCASHAFYPAWNPNLPTNSCSKRSLPPVISCWRSSGLRRRLRPGSPEQTRRRRATPSRPPTWQRTRRSDRTARVVPGLGRLGPAR